MLREVEGLSTAETAACLEINEETVKTRLHRARALLRNHITARIAALRRAAGVVALRLDAAAARVRSGAPIALPHDDEVAGPVGAPRRDGPETPVV